MKEYTFAAAAHSEGQRLSPLIETVDKGNGPQLDRWQSAGFRSAKCGLRRIPRYERGRKKALSYPGPDSLLW